MPEPIYRSIAEDLRRQVETGELRPGQQLRTEIELRDHYNASRNTIRDAIKWLITRGLVETRPGQGTFVTEKIDPFVTTLTGDPNTSELSDETIYLAEVQASGRVPLNSPTRVEIQEADAVIADALRIAEGASVEYLRNELGIAQVGYRDSIAVRAPDATETLFFKLPDDGRVSVFQIFRVGFYENGGRLRLTVTVYPADRNRFLVKVGKVPETAQSVMADTHAPPVTNEVAG
jgi:GntR family transcriptional regulator